MYNLISEKEVASNKNITVKKKSKKKCKGNVEIF